MIYVLRLPPTGVAEPVDITDNGDGTHTVNYTPARDGPYTVCVKYADQEVPRRSGTARAHSNIRNFTGGDEASFLFI